MKWFDVKNIREKVFSISEPHHWERTRAFLFEGDGGAILIDTGTGISDISKIVKDITDLPVLVLITHSHWDHIGCVDKFERVSVHESDAEWLSEGLPLPVETIREQVLKEPFDFRFCPDFDIEKYRPPVFKNPGILIDGEVITDGRRRFRVIHTPGHSPGSVSFFEEGERLLVTGDTFYRGTIYANYPGTDPHKLYESIKRLAELKPNLILPGHNDDFLEPHLLYEALDFLNRLESQGLIKQGSGLHEAGEIDFLL